MDFPLGPFFLLIIMPSIMGATLFALEFLHRFAHVALSAAGPEAGEIFALPFSVLGLWVFYELLSPVTPGLMLVPVLSAAYVYESNLPEEDVGETFEPTGPARRPTYSGPLDLDSAFSRVVFLDFAHALYHRVVHARVDGDAAAIRPYLTEAALRRFGRTDSDDPTQVQRVIVGNIRIVGVDRTRGRDEIEVEFTSNLELVRNGVLQKFYCEEIWSFTRMAGSISVPPDRAKTLGCPACGAPVELTTRGRCVHCDEAVIHRGEGWRLFRATEMYREEMPAPQPSPGVAEAGTDAPTVYCRRRDIGMRRIAELHPDHDWNSFVAYVRDAFLELQTAWAAADTVRLRGLETDRLYQSHRFWLDHYAAVGWKNVLEDAEVEKVEIVRVDVDAYYEAVTVRIRAVMIDYTVDVDGSVVIGAKGTPHPFSEYWTFLRTVGAASEHAGSPQRCPACGAPRDRVTEKGICGYCDSNIVGGDHDWILAFIQQDEEYV